MHSFSWRLAVFAVCVDRATGGAPVIMVERGALERTPAPIKLFVLWTTGLRCSRVRVRHTRTCVSQRESISASDAVVVALPCWRGGRCVHACGAVFVGEWIAVGVLIKMNILCSLLTRRNRSLCAVVRRMSHCEKLQTHKSLLQGMCPVLRARR